MSFINENPNNTIKEISLPNGESYTFNAEYLDGKAFSDIVELINKAADMGFNLHVCTKAEDTPYGVILDSGLEPVTGALVAEDAEKKTFYLVKSDKTKNDYDEYVVVDSFKTPKWEKIGSTEIDIDSLKKIFTRSENGMVPAPGAAQSLPRILNDSASWSYNSMYIVRIHSSFLINKTVLEQHITLEKLQPYSGLGVMLVQESTISASPMVFVKNSCFGIKIYEETDFNTSGSGSKLNSVSFLLYMYIDERSSNEWVFATLDANGWTYTPIFQEVKNNVYVNYGTTNSYNIIKNAIDNKQMVYVRYGHQRPLSIDWTEYPYSETIQTGRPAGKPNFRFSNGVNYFDVRLEESDGIEITSWTPLTSCADQTIIEGSTNAVSGGAVYNAIQDAIKEPLKVTITESEGSYTTDVSSAEIYAAWLEGRYVYAQFENNLLTLGTEPSATACTFQMSPRNGIKYMQFTVRNNNKALKASRDLISNNSTESNNVIYSTLLLDYVIDSDKQAVNKEYVDAQIATRQPNLTFDSVPTEGSDNPVTSGGVHDALAAKSLTTTVATTVGHTITATFTDGDNGLRFDVAGDVIQMDFRKDDLQNTRFLATQEYVDAAMAAFEPYRAKQFIFTGEWSIPSCTADIANTSIPKFVMKLEGDEAADYAFVGMISYEVFDAETGGNRLNYMPVCQFTGAGQTELSVRGCVMGSTAKTAKRVSCWALLKHR